MINGSNMDGMTEYGVDNTYNELPAGSAWSGGIDPERTLPAPWWNALMGLISKNLNRSKLNTDNIVAEIVNMLSVGSITPDPLKTDQLKSLVNDFLRNASNLSSGTVPQARLSAASILALLLTVDGSGSGLDADMVDGSHYNASDILTKLKTVDGAGSGLDADTVDGVDTTRIVYGTGAAAVTTITDANTPVKSGFYNLQAGSSNNGPTNNAYFIEQIEWSDNNHAVQVAYLYDNTVSYIRRRNVGAWSSWIKVWNAENDGSGSGLDADLLDGAQRANFMERRNQYVSDFNAITTSMLGVGETITFVTGFQPDNRPSGGPNYYTGFISCQIIDGSGYISVLAFGATGSGSPDFWYRQSSAGVWGSWGKLWNSVNDGSGSGLDADLLDGRHGVSFVYDNPYVISSGSILNAFTHSGVYTGASGAVDMPSGGTYLFYVNYYDSNSIAVFAIQTGINNRGIFYRERGVDGWAPWLKIWTEGNDGSGSGLDADLLDGIDSSRFIYGSNANGTNQVDALNGIRKTGSYTLTSPYTDGPTAVPYAIQHIEWPTGDHSIQMAFRYNSYDMYIRRRNTTTWTSWANLWTSVNDGSGSGLDADLLDGLHATDIKQAITGIQVLTADPSSPSDGTIWLRSNV